MKSVRLFHPPRISRSISKRKSQSNLRFRQPLQHHSRRSAENPLRDLLRDAEWSGVQNYFRKIEGLGGNANEIINLWKVRGFPNSPERPLSISPAQAKIVQDHVPRLDANGDIIIFTSDAPLRFGSGWLYHGVPSVWNLIEQGKIVGAEGSYWSTPGSIEFTRVAHTHAHPFFEDPKENHPGLIVIDTGFFNKLLTRGHAKIKGKLNAYCEDARFMMSSGDFDRRFLQKLDKPISDFLWHPYPTVLRSIALEEVKEIWVWEHTYELLMAKLAHADQEAPSIRLLRFLVESQRLKSIEVDTNRTFPSRFESYGSKSPEKKEVFRRAVLLYLLRRNLWMQIPLLESCN